MSDYTLPPVPHHPNPTAFRDDWTALEVAAILAHGHACAEHVRAPLIARIAELEAARDSDYEFDAMRIDRDRLRAEVEALRAASMIEWEPGRSYTAAELLRRAIQGLRVRKDHDLWPAVRNMCGVGSTVAHYLCRWAGRDPNTGKEIAARKGEGV